MFLISPQGAQVLKHPRSVRSTGDQDVSRESGLASGGRGGGRALEPAKYFGMCASVLIQPRIAYTVCSIRTLNSRRIRFGRR